MAVHTKLSCSLIQPGDELLAEFVSLDNLPRGEVDCPECGNPYRKDCEACNTRNSHTFERGVCICCGAYRSGPLATTAIGEWSISPVEFA